MARWLRAHESFADLPPASVTVWDSYLAYGVALGAAPGAAAIVDLRVGQVDVIRSPLGGGRIVRVRYPRTGGLKSAGAGLRIVCAVSGIALAAAIATRDLPGWATIAVAALAGLLSLRWAYRIVRSLADLLRPARISGQVLRIVPFGTVGDAESTNRASPRRAGMLRPGDVVDARVQPWTKRLISAAPLPR